MTPLTQALALRNVLGGMRPRSPAVEMMDGVIEQLRLDYPKEDIVETKVEPISDPCINLMRHRADDVVYRYSVTDFGEHTVTLGMLLTRIDHERRLREKAEGLADVGQRLLQAIEAGQKHHRAMRNWRAVSTPAEIVLHLLCEIDTTETEAKRLREAVCEARAILSGVPFVSAEGHVERASEMLKRAIAPPGDQP